MRIFDFPKFIFIKIIQGYQLTISPDHGFLFRGRFPYGFCRHYPSCSEYAKQSIKKSGLVKGAYLGAKRVLKCNPWAEPKVDLI